ncbi:MAG: imidazolonepropionase [Bacteroidales bacterium]|nr:imidazolonepropionase [Bacteroidales bacterium]
MKRIFIHIGILGGTETHPRLRVQGKEMLEFTTISDAFLTIVDGLIAAFGPMSSLDLSVECPDEVIDLQGRSVLPAWCDPHTHIVYAGSRECEFVDKIRGLSYEEIACRGGGILNSADLLHLTDEDELYRQALQRAVEVMHKGTGCLEIKSGYGLNLDDELKMLRVIRRLRDALPMRVVSTFLGAHAVGRAYSHEEYVRLVIDEMIPEVGRQQLADYIDVFCDKGFFTPEETSRMLEAGAKWGMLPKIHAEELAASGGVRVGVAHRALSVDHLESMDITGIEVLSGSETMPTVLPGTSFFLNMPWAPARKMIEAGLGVAVASDYNPGSTPSGDMKFIVSLACIKLRLLPEEALNAATLNSAYAMGLSADYGSLAVGKVANFMVTAPIPSLAFIPYAYTTPLVEQVWLQGDRV